MREAIPISDTVLAKEVAKGLAEPAPSVAPLPLPPQVILWDELDRPGLVTRIGDGSAFMTVIGGR